MIFLEGSVDQPPAKFHCLAQNFDQVCGASPLIPTEELLSVSFGWRVLYELNACHASKAHCRDLRDSVKHLPKPGMMFLSFLFLDVLTFRTTPNLIPALIHGLLLQMVLWNHFLSTDHCHCKLRLGSEMWHRWLRPQAYVLRGWLGLYLCSSRRKSPRRFWSVGWCLCGWNGGRLRVPGCCHHIAPWLTTIFHLGTFPEILEFIWG